MANKMQGHSSDYNKFFGSVLILVSVGLVTGAEELTFQYAPKSITFNPSKSVQVSQLADVFSSLLGFTTTETSWEGIKSVSPFDRPEVIMFVTLDGFKTVDAKLDGKKFPLETNVESSWPYQMLSDRIFLHFPLQKPVLVEVNSDNLYILKYQYPDIVGDLPLSSKEADAELASNNSVTRGRELTSLEMSKERDAQLLRELQILADIGRAAVTNCRKDGVPDLFWIQLSGVRPLVARYGLTSPQVEEAVTLIKDALQQVQSQLLSCYGDRVLLAVATSGYEDPVIVRKTRAVTEPSGNCSSTNVGGCNIAAVYGDGYPATFHIVSFTMLLYVLAVFGVGLGIWNMDPGRDSIIYRMTSTRMKRD